MLQTVSGSHRAQTRKATSRAGFRAAICSLLTLVAFQITPLQRTVQAQSYTYSPVAAATYAASNWVNGSNANPFPTFYSGGSSDGGGNCTNFASQCIMAGFVGSWHPIDVYQNRGHFVADIGGNPGTAWYFLSSGTKSSSWAGANNLYVLAKANKLSYKGLHFQPNPWDYRNVVPGDIIFADWEADGIVDHSIVVTGIDHYYSSGWSGVFVAYQNSVPQNNRGGSWSMQSLFNKHKLDAPATYQKAVYYIFRPLSYSTAGL